MIVFHCSPKPKLLLPGISVMWSTLKNSMISMTSCSSNWFLMTIWKQIQRRKRKSCMHWYNGQNQGLAGNLFLPKVQALYANSQRRQKVICGVVYRAKTLKYWDPKTDLWKDLTHLPNEVEDGYGAVVSDDNKVYIAGSFSNDNSTDTAAVWR